MSVTKSLYCQWYTVSSLKQNLLKEFINPWNCTLTNCIIRDFFIPGLLSTVNGITAAQQTISLPLLQSYYIFKKTFCDWMREYKVFEEWYQQDKNQSTQTKAIPVPLCLSQIPHWPATKLRPLTWQVSNNLRHGTAQLKAEPFAESKTSLINLH